MMILGDFNGSVKCEFYTTIKEFVGNGLAVSEGSIWSERRKALSKAFNSTALKNYMPLFIEETDSMIKQLNQKERPVDLFSVSSECTLKIINGSIWTKRRRALTKAFHPTALNDYMSLFIKETDSLIEQLKQNEGPIELFSVLSECTLKMINEAVVGSDLKINEFLVKKYIEAINVMTNTIQFKASPFYIDFIYNLSTMKKNETEGLKTIKDFSSHILDEMKSERFRYSNEKSRILKILSSKKEIFNDEDVKNEIDTLLFSGHDTTLSALIFTLMALANFPEYQESLRLFPPVTWIARTLTKEFQLKTGTLLPVGTKVILPIFDIHRNPNLFPDPERFDPDRFLPDSVEGRHSFCYMPFGAGSRNCLGQKFALLELKVVVCKIARQFRLETLQTLDDITFSSSLILRTMEEIKIKFLRRQ